MLPLGAKAAPASEATLWVQGEQTLHFAADAGRRDFWGSIGLSVPWQLLLAQRAAQPQVRERTPPWHAGDTASPAEPVAAPPRETDPGVPASNDVMPAPTPTVEPKSESGRRTPRAFRLTASLVRDTLARALRAQGTARAEARLNSLERRARWSALLPELRLRAARATDESLRLNPTISEPYRYTRDGGTDVILEARLSWRLSGLLFNSPEISIERIRLQRAARREQIEREVLKVLFEWQRARVLANDESALEEERQAAALSQLEAELTLNVLTDGWFPGRAVPTTQPKGP